MSVYSQWRQSDIAMTGGQMARLDELTDPQFEEFLSALYLTMLRLGRPTREALVEAGHHPEDVDRAAAFLAARQLISDAGPGVWDIVPPEVALPRLATALETRARSTRNTATELGALWRKARDEPAPPGFVGVEMLRSVDLVVLAAYSMAATADQRLRAFLDDSPVSRRLVLEEGGLFSRASLRPSEVGLVVDVRLFAHDGVLAALEAGAAAGQRIAVADGLPFSGLIVDDRAALIDLSRHDARADGSFVVRRRAPIAAVEALFEVAFELSTPMAPTLARLTGGSDQPPLVERDRRILGLLATGATDQQIARSLNVSTRTVERRVSVLMNTLGAATRFQAGVQATRREWI